MVSIGIWAASYDKMQKSFQKDKRQQRIKYM